MASFRISGVRYGAVALALALAVSACGADGETTAGDGGEIVSPLQEYLGDAAGFAGFDGSDESQAQIAARQQDANEKTAACMAAEGFEWKPDPQSVDVVDFIDSWPDPSAEDYVDTYGFGISTLAFSQSQVGPNLAGYPDDADSGAGFDDSYVDPNEAYVSSLSPADQEAFYSTLHGNDQGPPIDESMSEEEIQAAVDEYFENYVPTGCYGAAQDGVFGGGINNFWLEFSDELESIYTNLENDPRIVAKNQELSECVAKDGLAFTTMEDVQQTIYNQVEPIQEEVWNIGFPDEAMLEAGPDEAVIDEEFAAEFFENPALTPSQQDQLAEIQAEEIKLAKAVDACGGGEGDLTDLYQEVVFEAEERFIEENRDALEAYKAEQQSGDDSTSTVDE